MPSRETTAFHEAGHAVAHVLLRNDASSASIVPEEDRLGHIQQLSASYHTVEEAEDEIMVSLDGQAAQCIRDGRPPNWTGGSWSDHEQAQDVLETVGCEEEEAVSRLYDQTERFLEANWQRVERVAKLLLKHERLCGQAVDIAVNVEDEAKRRSALSVLL